MKTQNQQSGRRACCGISSGAVKSLGNSVIDVALKNWADRVATLAAEAKVEYDAMVQDANKKGEYSE